MVVLRSLAAAAVVFTAGVADAHVSLVPTTALAESYQVLRFGVGHGCDGRATTALRIELAMGVTTARPQPKPGWSLRVERPAGTPEMVSAIIWTGRLAPDQFDEFLILTKLPAAVGTLAFPAIQTCGELQNRWVETVAPNTPRPTRPAPTLTVVPVAPASQAGHQHNH